MILDDVDIRNVTFDLVGYDDRTSLAFSEKRYYLVLLVRSSAWQGINLVGIRSHYDIVALHYDSGQRRWKPETLLRTTIGLGNLAIPTSGNPLESAVTEWL